MIGSCLCGGVVFEAQGKARPVIECHCTQCRKQSGHFWAASSVPMTGFRLINAATLAWYAASDSARRGFCTCCGAFLLWHPTDGDRMSFAAGAIDGPTGLQTAERWYLEDAGDYYVGGAPTQSGAVLHGACLCGANRFALPGPMGEVTACHCHQCRKTSGHFAASFDVEEGRVVWEARKVAEYVTPGGGTRGFCPVCASGLWFRAADGSFSVEAGVMENPTGGRLVGHIFVADKGDYYALSDGLPQD